MDPDPLKYIINHAFLPPRLPQEDDYNAKYSKVLIETCQTRLKEFVLQAPAEHRQEWVSITLLLRNMLAVIDGSGKLIRQKLTDVIMKMYIKGKILSISSEIYLFLFLLCFFHRSSSIACRRPKYRNRYPTNRGPLCLRGVRTVSEISRCDGNQRQARTLFSRSGYCSSCLSSPRTDLSSGIDGMYLCVRL